MKVKPGGLLRRRALGTEAVYRVVAVEGELVEVEVVRAPGLEAGTRVRLALRDARAMEPLASDAEAARATPEPAVRTAD